MNRKIWIVAFVVFMSVSVGAYAQTRVSVPITFEAFRNASRACSHNPKLPEKGKD